MDKILLRQSLYGGLYALSNFIIVLFIIVYMHTQKLDAPQSLQDVLGPNLSVAWTWGIGAGLIVAGILAPIQKAGAMRAESVVRAVTAFPIVGYGIALMINDKIAWITVGLVFALAVQQIARYVDLTLLKIPQLEAHKLIVSRLNEYK